jgi:hypothetical protein
MPPGAFFFLFTYFMAPGLIGASFYQKHYSVGSTLLVWWLPMIYSAIKDWREHHFGYESRFSKIWFWCGVWIMSVAYLVFIKKHGIWLQLSIMIIPAIIFIIYFVYLKRRREKHFSEDPDGFKQMASLNFKNENDRKI